MLKKSLFGLGTEPFKHSLPKVCSFSFYLFFLLVQSLSLSSATTMPARFCPPLLPLRLGLGPLLCTRKLAHRPSYPSPLSLSLAASGACSQESYLTFVSLSPSWFFLRKLSPPWLCQARKLPVSTVNGCSPPCLFAYSSHHVESNSCQHTALSALLLDSPLELFRWILRREQGRELMRIDSLLILARI